MRVIGGIARGTKLFSPLTISTRPTADKTKESLFNMLAPYLAEIDFLDLFSGSGAIGIEALSRGASSAVFVDYSAEACNVIKKNLNKTKFTDNSLVIKAYTLDAITKLKKLNREFHIVFMDPPYMFDKFHIVLSNIKKHQILKGNGIIVIEHSSNVKFINEGFNIFKQKIYKTTTFTFLEATL